MSVKFEGAKPGKGNAGQKNTEEIQEEGEGEPVQDMEHPSGHEAEEPAAGSEALDGHEEHGSYRGECQARGKVDRLVRAGSGPERDVRSQLLPTATDQESF